MHHDAGEQRPAKLAFLFDRLSLLSRPDLGTDGRGCAA